MRVYKENYIAFSTTIINLHGDDVKRWAKDESNPELAKSCRMMIEAAEVAQ